MDGPVMEAHPPDAEGDKIEEGIKRLPDSFDKSKKLFKLFHAQNTAVTLEQPELLQKTF